MSAELQARKEVKDLITVTVPDVPVVWAGMDQPTSGEYVVLTVVSAPVINTFDGYAFQRVRVQVDVWHLSGSDSTVGTHGGWIMQALSDAGWNVQAGNLYPPEGQKDSAGKRWQRYGLDAIREFSHT